MITNIPLNIKNPYTQDSYCFDVPLFPITLLVGQYKTSIINAIQKQRDPYDKMTNFIVFDNFMFNSTLNSNRPKEIKKLIECLRANDILLVDDIDLFYDMYNNAIDIFENVPNDVQIICSAHNYDFMYYFLGKILDLQHNTEEKTYGITRIRQYKNEIRTATITDLSYSMEHYAQGLQAESYLKGNYEENYIYE